ncbi:aldehyde dehydrogenase [candidate division WOR_3 bacterium SM23_42]|uniref:Aldehyde dehydrogenase n=1 Tax=candidate division WOR_3 bacterium SM23_42 TaxID=1703779 RepID=A0A0S8FQM5_UNCW3|nr:MAG: aldehyde dehydrogenase [candidate division WOR_3 bacterium SM23_42]
MKMLIGGQWIDKQDKIPVYRPFDGEVIDHIPSGTKDDVLKAIESAVEGFQISKKMPVHKRMEILWGVVDYIRKNFEDFARMIASEGSKTIREARKETARCINTISVSAEEARRILGETIPFDSFPGGENRVGYYYRFPIGVIVAITPFNDPLNLVAHKLGPAIAAGNSVVLKPATDTPLSAIKLGEAFLAAGLPPKVLNIVTGRGSEIGDVLVSHPAVRMITLTGGVDAGVQILKQSGLKKISMELGSNCPVIVCEDADMSKAIDLSVSGAFWAVGQNCIGVQRMFIHENVFDDYVKKFVDKTKTMKVGNQLDESTDMGAMINEREAKRVEEWVNDAVEQGGKILTGGKRNGNFYDPTVMTDVPESAKLAVEEVFGPVVLMYKYNDLDDAIKRSNSVNYGLHAAVFTQDVNKAFKAVYELDFGSVIVNDSTDYRLDEMPFGGVKNSGLGREGIKFSLLEQTEPKVVCFNL